jgi:hypothetical protein
MSKRPSNKEKINKIREAREAVQKGCRRIPLSKHLAADLAELEIENEGDYWKAIEAALGEIAKAGPVDAYAGRHPPEKSYDFRDVELWAYRWDSKRFGKKMYIKFAIKNKHYLHIDCHENRPKQ